MTGRTIALALLIPALALTAGAQESVSKAHGPKVLKFSPDSVILIKETATLIGHQHGVLKVILTPSGGRELTGVQAVDLAEGDELGMAAGKRITNVAELRKLYEEAPAGSEFKLGVRRQGRPIVVVFTRKDSSEMGSGGLMIVKAGDPKADGTSLFPALGFALKQDTKGLSVAEVLPDGPFALKTGDTISSLNGTPTTTLEEFESVLGSIKAGEQVVLLLNREGNQLTLQAPRPEPRGTVLKVK